MSVFLIFNSLGLEMHFFNSNSKSLGYEYHTIMGLESQNILLANLNFRDRINSGISQLWGLFGFIHTKIT